MKGTKKVRGNNYDVVSEKMAMLKKMNENRSSVDTAGMDSLLKKSQKKQGYGKLAKVKPSKKGKGFIK